MIRLKKKKMQKGETAYLKSRIKESCRNNEVNGKHSHNSSSLGSLPQLNPNCKAPNILMQNQLTRSNPVAFIHTREVCQSKPISIFDEMLNCPSPAFRNSKYKNSGFESSNRGDSNMWKNPIIENPPNCIDMKRSFLRDKDSRLNKIIMRGGLTSSSSSTAQCYETKDKVNQLTAQSKLNYYRTSTSPLNTQTKKTVKPGDMITVNIGGVPFISGANQDKDRPNTHSNQNILLDNNKNLISPKMARTKSKKNDISKDSIKNQNQPEFLYVDNDSSFSKSNSFGASKEKVKSRNKQRKYLREFNQENKKRSLSRGSRIEGKINEDEMLPVAQDLTEEELNKYKYI